MAMALTVIDVIYMHTVWIQLEISDETLDNYVERFSNMERKHMAFFQLKMVLGPCVETLILLDRLAYLLEQVSTHWALIIYHII